MPDKKDNQGDKTQLIRDIDITQEDQTQMLKTMFPGRTDAELVKINRNFLKDAVPFELSRLIDELKNIPEGLQTGFKKVDESIRIPNGSITLVTGPSKQGKSLFMMNMLFNMTQIYKGKHFLYYNYQEPKKECELKFINIAGEKSFDFSKTGKTDEKNSQIDLKTNFDIWKNNLKKLSESDLLKLASEDIRYKGLMNFLDVSNRIHIIDSNYNDKDLIESIKLFKGPFIIGAVFIDFIQKIDIRKDEKEKKRSEQVLIISEYLRRFSNQLNFPVIVGAQYSNDMKYMNENAKPHEDSILRLDGLEHDANLIFDVRLNDKSNDTLNLKVVSNRIGLCFESKLSFNNKLMKIIDFE